MICIPFISWFSIKVPTSTSFSVILSHISEATSCSQVRVDWPLVAWHATHPLVNYLSLDHDVDLWMPSCLKDPDYFLRWQKDPPELWDDNSFHTFPQWRVEVWLCPGRGIGSGSRDHAISITFWCFGSSAEAKNILRWHIQQWAKLADACLLRKEWLWVNRFLKLKVRP